MTSINHREDSDLPNRSPDWPAIIGACGKLWAALLFWFNLAQRAANRRSDISRRGTPPERLSP